MEKPRIPKVATFKEEIKPSRYDAFQDSSALKDVPRNKLYEFSDSDKFIVRKVEEHALGDEREDLIQEAGIAKRLYDELREKYGIDAPVNFVIAEDENSSSIDKKTLFAITDHIRKIDHATSPELKMRAKEEYRKLWDSLLIYYEAKSHTLDSFLIDLSDTRQYVFGTKEGDEDSKWYLVDTDPMFSRFKDTLYDEVENLSEELVDIADTAGIETEDLIQRCHSLLKFLETSTTPTSRDLLER